MIKNLFERIVVLCGKDQCGESTGGKQLAGRNAAARAFEADFDAMRCTAFEIRAAEACGLTIDIQLRTQMNEVGRGCIEAAVGIGNRAIFDGGREIAQGHAMIEKLCYRYQRIQCYRRTGRRGRAHDDLHLLAFGCSKACRFPGHGKNRKRQAGRNQLQRCCGNGVFGKLVGVGAWGCLAGQERLHAATQDFQWLSGMIRRELLGDEARRIDACLRKHTGGRRKVMRLQCRCKRHPGVAEQIGTGAAIVCIGHECADPGVFDRISSDAAAANDRAIRNSARHQRLADLVIANAEHAGKIRDRHFDDTVHVASGRATGAQQCNQQAGLVDIVAGKRAQGGCRSLLFTGIEFGAHLRTDEIENTCVVMAQTLGLGQDFGGENFSIGSGQILCQRLDIDIGIGITGHSQWRFERVARGQARAGQRQQVTGIDRRNMGLRVNEFGEFVTLQLDSR